MPHKRWGQLFLRQLVHRTTREDVHMHVGAQAFKSCHGIGAHASWALTGDWTTCSLTENASDVQGSKTQIQKAPDFTFLCTCVILEISSGCAMQYSMWLFNLGLKDRRRVEEQGLVLVIVLTPCASKVCIQTHSHPWCSAYKDQG